MKPTQETSHGCQEESPEKEEHEEVSDNVILNRIAVHKTAGLMSGRFYLESSTTPPLSPERQPL
jgi:hypothetical protein